MFLCYFFYSKTITTQQTILGLWQVKIRLLMEFQHCGLSMDCQLSTGKCRPMSNKGVYTLLSFYNQNRSHILQNRKFSRAGNFRDFREFPRIRENFLLANITILQQGSLAFTKILQNENRTTLSPTNSLSKLASPGTT